MGQSTSRQQHRPGALSLPSTSTTSSPSPQPRHRRRAASSLFSFSSKSKLQRATDPSQKRKRRSSLFSLSLSRMSSLPDSPSVGASRSRRDLVVADTDAAVPISRQRRRRDQRTERERRGRRASWHTFVAGRGRRKASPEKHGLGNEAAMREAKEDEGEQEGGVSDRGVGGFTSGQPTPSHGLPAIGATTGPLSLPVTADSPPWASAHSPPVALPSLARLEDPTPSTVSPSSTPFVCPPSSVPSSSISPRSSPSSPSSTRSTSTSTIPPTREQEMDPLLADRARVRSLVQAVMRRPIVPSLPALPTLPMSLIQSGVPPPGSAAASSGPSSGEGQEDAETSQGGGGAEQPRREELLVAAAAATRRIFVQGVVQAGEVTAPQSAASAENSTAATDVTAPGGVAAPGDAEILAGGERRVEAERASGTLATGSHSMASGVTSPFFPEVGAPSVARSTDSGAPQPSASGSVSPPTGPAEPPMSLQPTAAILQQAQLISRLLSVAAAATASSLLPGVINPDGTTSPPAGPPSSAPSVSGVSRTNPQPGGEDGLQAVLRDALRAAFGGAGPGSAGNTGPGIITGVAEARPLDETHPLQSQPGDEARQTRPRSASEGGGPARHSGAGGVLQRLNGLRNLLSYPPASFPPASTDSLTPFPTTTTPPESPFSRIASSAIAPQHSRPLAAEGTFERFLQDLQADVGLEIMRSLGGLGAEAELAGGRGRGASGGDFSFWRTHRFDDDAAALTLDRDGRGAGAGEGVVVGGVPAAERPLATAALESSAPSTGEGVGGERHNPGEEIPPPVLHTTTDQLSANSTPAVDQGSFQQQPQPLRRPPLIPVLLVGVRSAPQGSLGALPGLAALPGAALPPHAHTHDIPTPAMPQQASNQFSSPSTSDEQVSRPASRASSDVSARTAPEGLESSSMSSEGGEREGMENGRGFSFAEVEETDDDGERRGVGQDGSEEQQEEEEEDLTAPRSGRDLSPGEPAAENTGNAQQPQSQPQPAGPAPEAQNARSWLIFVLAGIYPASHPIFTTPALFVPGNLGSPNGTLDYETMLRLAELIGQHKPPTTTQGEVERAGLRIIKALELTEMERKGEVLGNTTERCLICLSDYEHDDDLRLLKCRHIFHRDCVDQWLTTGRNSCPACREVGVSPSFITSPEPALSPAAPTAY